MIYEVRIFIASFQIGKLRIREIKYIAKKLHCKWQILLLLLDGIELRSKPKFLTITRWILAHSEQEDAGLYMDEHFKTYIFIEWGLEKNLTFFVCDFITLRMRLTKNSLLKDNFLAIGWMWESHE